MKKDWSTVEILQHSRHDWLNKLQLIKGNIALNHLDRVNHIIEEVVIDAEQDTKLTNLHTPKFAEMIMTYNWDRHCMRLEFEILGDNRKLQAYDENLTEWFFGFFGQMDQFVDLKVENHLSLSIEPSVKRFFLDFRGILKEETHVRTWFKENCQDFFKLENAEISKEEMTIELVINTEL